jgi:hypothetical protein
MVSHTKNEILSITSTWLKLKIIMLSEINQVQKAKYHITSLKREIYSSELHEIETKMVSIWD